MEMSQPNKVMKLGICQTFKCSVNASNICSTHKVVACNTCAAIMHFNCEMKIKDGERFVIEDIKLLEYLVDKICVEAISSTQNNSASKYNDDLKIIKTEIKKLKRRIKREQVHVKNVDDLTENVKNLTKLVLESQVYNDYMNYYSRLQISNNFTCNLEGDTGEIGLYGIRTQFYLDTKKMEMDLLENVLKTFTIEMDKRTEQKVAEGVKQANMQASENVSMVNKKIREEANSTKNRFEKIDEMINKKFKEMQQENMSYFQKITKLNSRVKDLEESQEVTRRQNERLEDTHNEFTKNIQNILQEQKEMKGDLENIKKELNTIIEIFYDEKVTQKEKVDDFSSKINDLEEKSEKIQAIIKSCEKDLKEEIINTSKKIKKENKKVKEKIDEMEKSIQEDMKEKHENLDEQIEENYSTLQENYSDLDQRIDKIEQKLPNLVEFVDEEIKNRKEIQRKKEEEEEKKQTELKTAEIKEDLKLKDAEYYIEEFKDFEDFP